MLNISIRMAAIKDGGIKMSLQGKRYLLSEQERVALQRQSFCAQMASIQYCLMEIKNWIQKTLYEKAPKLKEVPLI